MRVYDTAFVPRVVIIRIVRVFHFGQFMQVCEVEGSAHWHDAMQIRCFHDRSGGFFR